MPFTELRVPRGPGELFVQDHAGTGPALVLLYGFPDNLHIYDEIMPFLVASGRRVVAFDSMGFGQSSKPNGFTYDFDQQRDDVAAVWWRR